MPGLGWQTAEPIADQNRPADPQVALASNGDALVEWRNASDADVPANRYVAGVGWQGVEVLAHERVFQGDAAPLPLFVNDAGDLVASWVRLSVPERVEYATSIPPRAGGRGSGWISWGSADRQGAWTS